MSEIPTSSEASSYFFSSYVKKTMQNDESQPVFFPLSRWQFFEAAFYFGLLLIIPSFLLVTFLIGFAFFLGGGGATIMLAIVSFFVLQALNLFYVHLKRSATEYAVSNKRVVIKVGILSRKTDEVRPEAIEAVTINQGITGRLLNFGDCIIRGRGVGNLRMSYVRDPLKVKRTIEQHTS